MHSWSDVSIAVDNEAHDVMDEYQHAVVAFGRFRKGMRVYCAAPDFHDVEEHHPHGAR